MSMVVQERVDDEEECEETHLSRLASHLGRYRLGEEKKKGYHRRKAISLLDWFPSHRQAKTRRERRKEEEQRGKGRSKFPRVRESSHQSLRRTERRREKARERRQKGFMILKRRERDTIEQHKAQNLS